MKNLYNDIQAAYDNAISINFKPEHSNGWKLVRDEYYMMYNAGTAAYVHITENGYSINGVDVWNALFPTNDSYLNLDCFPWLGGGWINAFLDTLFTARGLHTRNEKIDSIIKELIVVINSQMLPVVTLGDKEVYGHGGNPDYAFDLYYSNTKPMLRVYNIPKQGYIDIAI